MNHRPLLLAVASSLCLSAIAAAQTVTVELIPNASTVRDMSPDGRFIVGATAGDPYLRDLQEGTITILAGGLDATGVSDDGTVVVGCIPDPDDGVEVAGRWTEATGWVSLGWLPDALNCPSRSNAYEVSADGSVVTGLSWDGCSGRGFYWTEATGMLELEGLANGSNRASVISADGTLIGGFAQGSFSRTPAMWDGPTQVGTLLDPPDGDALGEVQGISDDGSMLLGNYDGDAFKYTTAGGVEVLGQGSIAASWTGIGCDIADNGMVVGFDVLMTSRRAWVMEPGADLLITLQSFIQDNGGTIPSLVLLEVASRISANGRTIVGHGGFFPSRGWIVTIEPCTGDVDGGGTVDFNDLLTVLANWGTDGPGADIAAPDDIVDFADLLGLLANWGPCP